jgi:predicted thioesterase
VARRVIRFEVEAFDGDRCIGAGQHGRGLVNTADFEVRFGVS